MPAVAGCVVIGAGLAGANVVQTLRDEGYQESITLIGNEGERPYERPPLSKDHLQGKEVRLYVHDETWYGEHDVDARFDDAATSIDRAAQRVLLSSGDGVAYDHLVIATGSRARRLDLPGADLAGVHTLRSRAESEALRQELTAGKRWVVIGGGWIGLEVAASARSAGCEVTVLETAELPLQNVMGDTVARHFLQLHRSHGVDLRTGVSVYSIEGDSASVSRQVTGVQTDSGLIPADVVLVAVGAAPNTELAAAAGLTLDRGGIVVDNRLRSEDPAILAAGDVAHADNDAMGRRLRVEHWDNAIRQGRLAASSVLGRSATYDWQPYFYTDQFDLGMEYVGQGGPSDQVVIRGDLDSGEFIAFWLDAGRVTAAMNVNTWDVNDQLRALIGKSVPPAQLTDGEIALTDL